MLRFADMPDQAIYSVAQSRQIALDGLYMAGTDCIGDAAGARWMAG